MLRDIGHVEIILALSAEIITLHMEVTTIEFGVSGFERSIIERGVCMKLTML